MGVFLLVFFDQLKLLNNFRVYSGCEFW